MIESSRFPAVSGSQVMFPGAVKGMAASAEPLNVWVATGFVDQIAFQAAGAVTVQVYDYATASGELLVGGANMSAPGVISGGFVVPEDGLSEIQTSSSAGDLPDRASFDVQISGAVPVDLNGNYRARRTGQNAFTIDKILSAAPSAGDIDVTLASRGVVAGGAGTSGVRAGTNRDGVSEAALNDVFDPTGALPAGLTDDVKRFEVTVPAGFHELEVRENLTRGIVIRFAGGTTGEVSVSWRPSMRGAARRSLTERDTENSKVMPNS